MLVGGPGSETQALANRSDAAVRQAVAAIKAPFVRAYTAFGEG